MAGRNCQHPRRTTGMLQCDLSRPSAEGSAYSTRLSVGICEDCGDIQLYCESHKTVCNWLANYKTKNESA